ncbi:MAG: glucosyltransferase domain-containing protein [Lactobacillaceae bacterium]|jgi:hypothetical protein|nr:glucosyltransferase domain-containing protein [Lactobacillaceae bacterium]
METYKIQFKKFFNKNKLSIIIIFSIYLIAILSIGIINYPYIDDIARQRTGVTDFAKSYSRWGSEITSWIIYGSKHLVDAGIWPNILTAIILAITSIIVLYSLTKKLDILPSIFSTLIGLNPWFLQAISFKFDSPFMAFSLLFSFLPFLWWKKKNIFFVISIISLLLMFNFYQASSGIYIVMVLALILKDLLAGEQIKNVILIIFLSAIVYIIATLLYVVETSFNPELISGRGNMTKIAEFKDLYQTFINNYQIYFQSIYNQSAKIWIILSVVLLIIFVTVSVIKARISFFESSCLCNYVFGISCNFLIWRVFDFC